MTGKRYCLLATLGNRDIQFLKDSISSLPQEWQAWFRKNNDADDYLIITKNQDSLSFFEITRILFENAAAIMPLVQFPLIEPVLQKITQNQPSPQADIYLFGTRQNPPDSQDCFFVAKMAQLYFQQKGFPAYVVEINQNPTDIPSISIQLRETFGQIKSDYDHVVIANSGGTPQMRTGSHFAGLFQGLTFLSINARTGLPEEESYLALEQIILREQVAKMVQVYDYEGIRKLPGIPEEVAGLCSLALDYYNLSRGIDEKLIYREKALKAIFLLIENTRICFTQGRYADTIGRLFRIEEAVGQWLFFLWAGQNNHLQDEVTVRWLSASSNKKKTKSFEKLLSSSEAMQSFLRSLNLEDVFELKCNKLYFKKYPDTPCASGKNFFYFFFKSLQIFEAFTAFFEPLNKDEKGLAYQKESRLNQLRNSSYLGHGFKGISKEDVESITGPVDQLLLRLQTLLEAETGRPCPSFFDEINLKITDKMS